MVEPKRCWMADATNEAGGHAACPIKLSDPAKERIEVISEEWLVTLAMSDEHLRELLAVLVIEVRECQA
jgi:hypothetical protein